MAIMRLKLWVLFATIMIATNFTYAAETVSSGQITGTWLYLYWHGAASVKKADGNLATRMMFIPESYREASDQKSESYLRFRGDGTGTFFKRYLIFKNNGAKSTVVTKDRHGRWVEGNRLDEQTELKWRITADKLFISAIHDSREFNNNGTYRYTINTLPTRPVSRGLTARLGLKDELVIYQLGQFLRVGRDQEEKLLKRYDIP